LNWKNKLHINNNNIYSTSTENKFLKIECAISNTCLLVINQIISKSDIHKIIANNIYYNENNLCPICCDTDNPIQTILAACGHQFCFDCIIKSIATSLKCPICRKYCDIKSIFIYSSIENISDGMMSYLNLKLKSHSQFVTQIPFLEKYIDKDNATQSQLSRGLSEEIIILEKNISMQTKQFINYKCLNNKNIKIIYMDL
jgi:hypothetical protein